MNSLIRKCNKPITHYAQEVLFIPHYKKGGFNAMEVLAVAIQKGGTGKTTTAAVLAQAAAHKGKKVLAIDLDPQGNLTFALGGSGTGGSSFDLLQGTAAADVIQQCSGIDVIAANWGLSTIASGKGSARRLQAAIEPIKNNYDLIINIANPAIFLGLQLEFTSHTCLFDFN